MTEKNKRSVEGKKGPYIGIVVIVLLILIIVVVSSMPIKDYRGVDICEDVYEKYCHYEINPFTGENERWCIPVSFTTLDEPLEYYYKQSPEEMDNAICMKTFCGGQIPVAICQEFDFT